MSGRSPGGPSWSGRSITATDRAPVARLALLLGLLAAPVASGRAEPFLDRLGVGPDRQPEVLARCGEDRLCAARLLAAADPARYRLVKVETPDTDTIRWVRTRPSITGVEPLGDGRLRVRVDRFGRRLLGELGERVPAGSRILLDLRGSRGGDFGRMLRLARALLGARLEPPLLETETGTTPFRLPGGAAMKLQLEGVLIGPRTASSAEVLAALANRAGVPLCGARSRGKDWLEEVVPVRQGWQLLVRRGRLLVPGVTLTGGLRPQRAAARCLAAAGG